MELNFFFSKQEWGRGSSRKLLWVLWSIAGIMLAGSYCPYMVICFFCDIVPYGVGSISCLNLIDQGESARNGGQQLLNLYSALATE